MDGPAGLVAGDFEEDLMAGMQFEPDWSKYPKLAAIFKDRPQENVYWDELRELLSDARADAVRFIEDVKAEELNRAGAAARLDERSRIQRRRRRG